MLQSELGLSVVVWLDQGFDPFQDLRRSCSRGFRLFQSCDRLDRIGRFLHPYSRWMVLRIGRILRRNAPWLRSCNMALSDVGVVGGSTSVGVVLVCDTLPLE